jgi:hypothetical protein
MTAKRKASHDALELRRFILSMYRARKWYMPRVTIKDVLKQYEFKLNERTVRRAIKRLRAEGFLDVWEPPPPL